MKKYILLIATIISFGIFTTSCSKFLDQEPQGEWVDGDQASGSVESDVLTLYAKVRHYDLVALPGLAIHSFRSEDAEKGSNASDGASQADMFDNFNYVATNGLILSYYNKNYEIIHTTNMAISKIDFLGSAITDGDKINKGEAHFFRAYAYFNLVRAFGEVPLINFPIKTADQANVPKSTIDKIYTLIDDDLKVAEENLPRTWTSAYVGRLTWGAARSLHAKTYLMRNDWMNTYTATTDVINSGLYNLNTDFSKIFREDGENSSESVWELQATATESQNASTDIGCQYAQVQGVRGTGQWDLGWGWNTPTQILANAFEADDPRKDETLLYFYKQGADAATIAATPTNKPYNEKPIAQSNVVNVYYNKKAYTNPTLRTSYGHRQGYWYNVRMIRYADVLLMAAEAANELGISNDALNFLEQVRARARREAPNALPTITTTNPVDLQTAIRHERRIELAMEFDRFYDLVRWGIALQVLHAAGKTGYQDRHRYLPLPQTAIDNSNGVLKQNPDY